jgi:hypothetical protein
MTRNMLEALTMEQLHAEKRRFTECLRVIDAEIASRSTPTRLQGDVWQDNDGKWCGMSSDGVSGPWDTKRAAELAAEDKFNSAFQADRKAVR